MSLVDFEAWLRANLPEAADSLNAGADEQALARLSAETGLALPPAFLELYRWHNGQDRSCSTGIFYGLGFMPIEDVLREWKRNAKVAQGVQESPWASGVVKSADVNRHWIAFADDAGGNFVAIDLDPGAKGVKGQVINYGCDEVRQYAIAPDVSSFVAWIVDQLGRGNHRIEEEDDGGRSFNIGDPESSHFLDAARVIFGGGAPQQPSAPKAPPRDSVPGVLYFMRTELAQQVPPNWKTMRIAASVVKTRAEFTAEYELEGGDRPLHFAPRDQKLIENAILEFQSRAKEERWIWSTVTIDFSVGDETGFRVDAQ
jgi:cell wall assembly regulator SMI1